VLITLQTLFYIAVLRVYFHPLSSYPGPRLWATSRIPYVVSLLRGTLNSDMLKIHERYGPVVRLAPNELSFATEEAWRDIYMYRKGHLEAKKDTIWYMGESIDISIRSRIDHMQLQKACHQTSLQRRISRSELECEDCCLHRLMSNLSLTKPRYWRSMLTKSSIACRQSTKTTPPGEKPLSSTCSIGPISTPWTLSVTLQWASLSIVWIRAHTTPGSKRCTCSSKG
jgi:hypothetical protein